MAVPALFGCWCRALVERDDRRVETAEIKLSGQLHDIATFCGH